MRLRNIPEAEAVLENFPALVRILDYFALQEQRFKIDDFFPLAQPLHLELGMGRGQFITTLAKQEPGINYLGIDQFTAVVYKALLRIQEQPLPNLRFLVLDVANLHFLLGENTLERIYLNFSDPWPNQGSSKKRLTAAKKLKMYQKMLKPGGDIHLKTDNEKFFEFSLNELAGADFQLRQITFDLHQSDFTGNIFTEYETRFSRAGKKIYRLEAEYQG